MKFLLLEVKFRTKGNTHFTGCPWTLPKWWVKDKNKGQQGITSLWRASSNSCFSSGVISFWYNWDKQFRILNSQEKYSYMGIQESWQHLDLSAHLDSQINGYTPTPRFFQMCMFQNADTCKLMHMQEYSIVFYIPSHKIGHSKNFVKESKRKPSQNFNDNKHITSLSKPTTSAHGSLWTAQLTTWALYHLVSFGSWMCSPEKTNHPPDHMCLRACP